ncbi:MAG TPA: hypothetical protein VFZ97_10045 [Acidimicrobiales bacterium]
MRRLAAVTTTVTAALVFCAPPASAHELHGGGVPQPLSQVLGRTVAGGVLIASTLLLAGLLAVGALMGRRATNLRRAQVTLAVVATVPDAVVLVATGSTAAKLFNPWPARLAALHLGVVTVLMLRNSRLGWRVVDGIGGTVLLVVLAWASHPKWASQGAASRFAIGLAHLDGAAIWVAAVLVLLLDREGRALPRRLGGIGITSAAVTVASGVLNVTVHLPNLGALPVTAYGRVLITKISLVAAAVLLGALAYRYRRSLRLTATEAGAMALVLVLAVTLVGMPGSSSRPPSDSSPLTRVRVGAQEISVVVTPDRPGPNLVQIATSDPLVEPVAWVGRDTRSLNLQSDDGAGEWSALTDLRGGTVRLHLLIARRKAFADIRVPSRAPKEILLGEISSLDGPDRAECLSRHIGHVVALAEANQAGQGPFVLTPNLEQAKDVVGACGPSDPTTLTAAVSQAERMKLPVFGAPQGTPVDDGVVFEPDPATLGRAYGQELISADARSIAVIGDDTLRSTAFVGGLQQVLAAHGIAATTLEPGRRPSDQLAGYDAAVVATGWKDARAALPASGKGPRRGIFFAPWLMDQGLMSESLTPDGVQIAVGVPEDLQSPIALGYLNALARFAPREIPSLPGLEGYIEARTALDQYGDRKPLSSSDERLDLATALARERRTGVTLAGVYDRPELQFFTPTRIDFLPPSLNRGHSGHSAPSFISDGGNLGAISAVFSLVQPG